MSLLRAQRLFPHPAKRPPFHLGANYWQTFSRITVPNLKLSIIGAALLIFTLSMDEIAVSFFLIGRDNTLPLEIWGRLRRGITPEINAISTIIFLFSLIAIVVWYRAANAGGSEAGNRPGVGRNFSNPTVSCHPERSRTIREASRSAESKDPYIRLGRRQHRFLTARK